MIEALQYKTIELYRDLSALVPRSCMQDSENPDREFRPATELERAWFAAAGSGWELLRALNQLGAAFRRKAGSAGPGPVDAALLTLTPPARCPAELDEAPGQSGADVSDDEADAGSAAPVDTSLSGLRDLAPWVVANLRADLSTVQAPNTTALNLLKEARRDAGIRREVWAVALEASKQAARRPEQIQARRDDARVLQLAEDVLQQIEANVAIESSHRGGPGRGGVRLDERSDALRRQAEPERGREVAEKEERAGS